MSLFHEKVVPKTPRFSDEFHTHSRSGTLGATFKVPFLAKSGVSGHTSKKPRLQSLGRKSTEIHEDPEKFNPNSDFYRWS